MKSKQKVNNELIKAYKHLWELMNNKEKTGFIFLVFLVVFRCFSIIAITQVLACLVNEISGIEGNIFGFKLPSNWNVIQIIIFTHILLIVIWCITAVIGHLIRVFAVNISCKVNKRILEILTKHRENLDFKMTNGEAIFIANSASESVIFLIKDLLLKIMLPIGGCLIALIYIAKINVFSFIVFTFCFLFIIISSFIRLKFESKYQKKIEKSKSKINNINLNGVENLPLIVMSDSKDAEMAKLQVHNNEYKINSIKDTRMRMKYWFVAYFIQYVLIGLGLITCVIQRGANIENIANIVALVSYSQQLCSPLENVGVELGQLQSRAIQFNRLELLKPQTKIKNGGNLVKILDLDSICIDKIDLNNIEIKIGSFNKSYQKISFIKNQLTVISGDSGKGKTILLGALLGLKTYKYGEIKINDCVVINSLSDCKNKVSYISQNAMIFDRTITENIAYPNDKLTDRMMYYVKKLNLQHLIKRDTEDINVIKSLSGGEQKRISIARGMSKVADVYIFDEPTNDLDNENVETIIQEITKLKENAIVIVVSHDKRVVCIADKIIDL